MIINHKKIYLIPVDIIKYILISLVKFYKILISPLFPNSCRYYPTCSTYTIEALQKYGLLKGLAKSIWRILRCHPFSKGGYDPL